MTARPARASARTKTWPRNGSRPRPRIGFAPGLLLGGSWRFSAPFFVGGLTAETRPVTMPTMVDPVDVMAAAVWAGHLPPTGARAERDLPGMAAIVAGKLPHGHLVVSPFHFQLFAFDQGLRDFTSGRVEDPLESRAGHSHLLGGLFLIQVFQILQPDGFQFFYRKVDGLRRDEVTHGLKPSKPGMIPH